VAVVDVGTPPKALRLVIDFTTYMTRVWPGTIASSTTFSTIRGEPPAPFVVSGSVSVAGTDVVKVGGLSMRVPVCEDGDISLSLNNCIDCDGVLGMGSPFWLIWPSVELGAGSVRVGTMSHQTAKAAEDGGRQPVYLSCLASETRGQTTVYSDGGYNGVPAKTARSFCTVESIVFGQRYVLDASLQTKYTIVPSDAYWQYVETKNTLPIIAWTSPNAAQRVTKVVPRSYATSSWDDLEIEIMDADWSNGGRNNNNNEKAALTSDEAARPPFLLTVSSDDLVVGYGNFYVPTSAVVIMRPDDGNATANGTVIHLGMGTSYSLRANIRPGRADAIIYEHTVLKVLSTETLAIMFVLEVLLLRWPMTTSSISGTVVPTRRTMKTIISNGNGSKQRRRRGTIVTGDDDGDVEAVVMLNADSPAPEDFSTEWWNGAKQRKNPNKTTHHGVMYASLDPVIKKLKRVRGKHSDMNNSWKVKLKGKDRVTFYLKIVIEFFTITLAWYSYMATATQTAIASYYGVSTYFFISLVTLPLPEAMAILLVIIKKVNLVTGKVINFTSSSSSSSNDEGDISSRRRMHSFHSITRINILRDSSHQAITSIAILMLSIQGRMDSIFTLFTLLFLTVYIFMLMFYASVSMCLPLRPVTATWTVLATVSSCTSAATASILVLRSAATASILVLRSAATASILVLRSAATASILVLRSAATALIWALRRCISCCTSSPTWATASVML
jgi:hypothetical protein